MNEYQTIIDVTPVAHSSTRIYADGESQQTARQNHVGTAYSRNTYSGNTGANARAGAGFATAQVGIADRMTGLVQVLIGVSLIAIGIPMLILPGPGLIAIGAGAVLTANGTRKLFR